MADERVVCSRYYHHRYSAVDGYDKATIHERSDHCIDPRPPTVVELMAQLERSLKAAREA